MKFSLKIPPKVHLVRAWMWWLLLPVIILCGLQASVFVLLIYSTYANFAADMATYEGAKNRKENKESD